jgi:hypothetical protein
MRRECGPASGWSGFRVVRLGGWFPSPGQRALSKGACSPEDVTIGISVSSGGRDLYVLGGGQYQIA